MVKRWQTQGLHLWKKETATIFLQKSQLKYTLGSSGDHASLSYEETTLSTDYVATDATFIFDDSVSATAADYIGIELDSGSLYWSTVQTVVSPTSVTIAGALPSAASEDKKVYIYTTRLAEPFNVYSAVRESSSEIDTPMNYLSYEEYFQLPNKTAESTPVSYNYDRQLNAAEIRVWPVPQNVEYLMKITMAQKIGFFESSTDVPDFPQEWHEALVLNLAVKIGPAFGKAGDANFAALKQDAMAAFEDALTFDSEQGSLYFQPDYTS